MQRMVEKSTIDYDERNRLDFLDIDDETREDLKTVRDMIIKKLPEIIDGFYAHVLHVPELRAKMGSDSNIQRLKQVQAQHWANLFSAQFDGHYMNNVNQIGQSHVKIGLEPRWYLGGYCYALNQIVCQTAQTYWWTPKRLCKVLAAINKAVFLDIDLAISTYIDTILGEIRKNASTVASAAEELSATSTQMQASSDDMCTTIQATAEDTEAMDSSIQSVAAPLSNPLPIFRPCPKAPRKSTRLCPLWVRPPHRFLKKCTGSQVWRKTCRAPSKWWPLPWKRCLPR